MQAPPKPKSPLGFYRLLSPTAGIRVSPLCLGTMSFGSGWKAMLGECNKTDTFKILDHYYDNGGNFIDSANVYHGGDSESWLGDWMKERSNRDELVIATKYTGQSPNAGSAKLQVNYGGNHTKSLLLSVEGSLQRLQTSYLDILYVHYWDYTTSVPELLRALNQLVSSGKVHYLGLSDAPAWVAIKANLYAQQHGLAQFSLFQGQYNAAIRDCEREIIPVCEDTGMAFVPYGALGGGRFRTKDQKEAANSPRANLPMYHEDEKYKNVTKALDDISKEKGVKITQVALAWTLLRAPNVFPLIGCRKLEYLIDAIDALTVQLSDEDVEKIEKASGFEPGFPINFIFQHFNPAVKYNPSLTAADGALSQLFARLDVTAKPKALPLHKKEEFTA